MTKQQIKPRHCGKLHWPKRLFAKAHPMITYPGAVMNTAPWQDEAFLAKRDLDLAAIDGPLCKIGVSRRPKRRVGGISMTQPHKAKLIKVWPKAGHLEPTVHHILRPLQQRGEWFKCEPDFAEWICEMVISQKKRQRTVLSLTDIPAAVDAAKASGAAALNVLASPVLYSSRRIVMQSLRRFACLPFIHFLNWRKKAALPPTARVSSTSFEN